MYEISKNANCLHPDPWIGWKP